MFRVRHAARSSRKCISPCAQIRLQQTAAIPDAQQPTPLHVLAPHSPTADEKEPLSESDLFQIQKDLETRVHDDAVQRYTAMLKALSESGKGSTLKPAQRLMLSWYTPLADSISQEQKDIVNRKSGIDRSVYGPNLLLLDSHILAVITMHEFLNLALIEPDGVKVVRVASAIGRAVEAEVKMNILKNKDKPKWKEIVDLHEPINAVNRKTREALEKSGQGNSWDSKIVVKVGACLLVKFMETAKIRDKKGEVEAFSHGYVFQPPRRFGVLKCHEEVFKTILKDRDTNLVTDAASPRYLPMVVEPRPWVRHDAGGYLQLPSAIMRTRGSKAQLDSLRKCHMPQVQAGLNALSQVQWQINRPLLGVIKELWEDGGGVAGLPPLADFDVPEDTYNTADDGHTSKKVYSKHVEKLKKANRDLHSMRCDMQLKIQIAQEFQEFAKIYFPYNIDFRGRAYPMPPNLNHLGNDVCRGLLQFAQKKPLGPDGLDWLKIHLANLCGKDKMSFAMRRTYIDSVLDEVRDSAQQPLDGNRWWMQADEPFQALATCMELTAALDSPDPDHFLSQLPVHQDGSCNGLQHYAALGRDELGGLQVNLLPTEEPQDVYTGVADLVIARIEKDAAMVPENEEQELHKRYAQLLQGQITRKVVKQTVMTSVYGVTFVGARKQIQARLEEKMLDLGAEENAEIEEQLYGAACYVARITMESLGTLFKGARDIMEWLGDCASIVAKEGQPMSWVTPLGLPVVQPYRRNGTFQVRTLMQHVVLADHSDLLPVSGVRQRSAFPPNYVHSLDSTHMLLTAIQCTEDGLSFAAVHDSYWTHAGTIHEMNQILRQQFINLYQQPLLEDLRESLMLRFPEQQFPEVPARGTLNLEEVLQSDYFFD